MENENKRAATEFIEREKKIFTDVSDDIGAHPELSLKEFHAAELYAEVLEKHGFQVEKGFGGIATAVKPELLAAAREEFRKRTKSGYVCPIEEGAVPTAL